MKRAFVLAAGIALAVASTSASALGSKEEAVLQVFGGIFLLDKIFSHQHRTPHQPQVQRYYDPVPPRYGYHSYPSYGSEVDQAYRQGQLERERREHQEAVQRAYQCGYYGNC